MKIRKKLSATMIACLALAGLSCGGDAPKNAPAADGAAALPPAEAAAPPAVPGGEAPAANSSPLTDTGHAGRWAWHDDGTLSVIEIRQVDGTYQFRWTLGTQDGSRRVDADWGTSEEFVAGEKAADYRFTVSQSPDTEHLLIECQATSVESDTTLQFKDRLEVADGGLILLSRMIEKDGKPTPEGEQNVRRFTKIADPQ
ncbi:hypothetical protein ABI59_03675 [Acidobacteria bacterium Mor1]|nr:hypothetical protein ABI59_03675 [Acidobacteria bacterium Mor1]